MKLIFKFLLKHYLKYAAKLALFLHRPRVIAVAGSSGKGFVKDSIGEMLRKKSFSVRVSPNNFNTEFGLPLAILDLPSGYGDWKDWRRTILGAPKAIFQKNFPQFLVLELGVSKKGDMKYLLSVIDPEVGVITDITQRYVESFSGVNSLIEEYAYLAKRISHPGLLVLNYDNMRVRELGKKSTAQKFSFGVEVGADFQIKSIERTDVGERVLLSRKGEEGGYQLKKFGHHHAMHLLATLAVEEYVKK